MHMLSTKFHKPSIINRTLLWPSSVNHRAHSFWSIATTSTATIQVNHYQQTTQSSERLLFCYYEPLISPKETINNPQPCHSPTIHPPVPPWVTPGTPGTPPGARCTLINASTASCSACGAPRPAEPGPLSAPSLAVECEELAESPGAAVKLWMVKVWLRTVCHGQIMINMVNWC